MKACIHVDYLSHEWTASDALKSYSQVRKEIRKLKSKQRSSNPFDAKEQKALRVENQLLARFENALWRQMSRTCTSRLGGHNPMVHPFTINWQKESDITWLYGPLYSHHESDNEQDDAVPTATAQQPSPYSDNHGLKPVLKKTNSYSSPDYAANLPRYMRRGNSVIAFDNNNNNHPSHGSQRTSFSSVSSSEFSAPTPPNNVRFSPETTKVQYYIPESPVQELGAAASALDDQWNPYWTLHDDEDDEEDDDDALWDLVLNISQHVKDTVLGWFTPPKQQQQQQVTTANVIFTFMSVIKSVASLMATWLIYQTLLKIVHTCRMQPGKRPPSLIDKHSLTLSIITWWRWQRHDERKFPASSTSTTTSS